MPGSISLYLAFAIMGFFLGSVMFALILPRHFKGIDIRKLSDDGNPGTANAVKYGGIWACCACWAICSRLVCPSIWRAGSAAWSTRFLRWSWRRRFWAMPSPPF